jgi:pimeloyl-ACP methyl ester carboxylesterase
MPLPFNAAYTQSSKSTHVKFSEYSSLASASEIARRTLSPLVALEVTRTAAHSGKALIEQTIKLPDEDFVIYVPAHRPPRGYALLVFVPPWQDARLPAGWAPILDRYDTIFVSAARCGNDVGVMDRREPLALLAAVNVIRQFPVDADAVFIGGFSGGARVAQRLALAYPDLFRGAILNAGSDPIGSQDMPLPPKDLFYRFQEHSQLVYVTGEVDARLGMDQDSMRSMHQWCVFAVQGHIEPSTGHEVLGSTAFAWALSALLHDVPAVSHKLPGCRASIEQDLDRQLNAAEQQLTGGAPGSGEQLLRKIDARYGGLAAPRSVDLANTYSQIKETYDH